jgi:hypothetical protein
MPRALAPALLFWLLAGHAAAEVRLQVRGARLDLTATAAPLTDVLDRLARQVGMKVQYDGPAPRQLVTLTLRDRTPSEAVLSVLEGLGVNFALVWDPSGAQLQTLVIAGSAGTTTAAAGQNRPPVEPAPRRTFGPPNPPGDAPEPGFEQEQEEPAAEGGSGVPETGAPAFGPPAVDPNAAASPNTQQPPPQVVAPQQQFPVSPFTPQPPMLSPPVQPSAPAMTPSQPPQ